MYYGILIALIIVFIFKKIFKINTEENLIIELPEYKIPSISVIETSAWGRTKEYLNKVGSTILIFSIIIWTILNFGPKGYTDDIYGSFGYYIGIQLESIFKIAGLGYWQIIISLISGLAGKELIVSTLQVTISNQNILNSDNLAQIFTNMEFFQSNAVCLMIFCLLYTPCIATIATIKKETNSFKFAVFCAIIQLIIAFVISTIVYQVQTIFTI